MAPRGALACSLLALLFAGCGEDPLSPLRSGTTPDDKTPAPAAQLPPKPAPKPAPPATLPPKPEPPPAPGICELIEARAGACPGYGYDCPSRPEAQSWCFYDMLLGLDDPCMVFADGQLCNWATGEVTLYGLASCYMQECFELTDANACVSNLQILCAFP